MSPKERFDATGEVRDFQRPVNGLPAKFALQVGNLAIPCHIERPVPQPPSDGERVRVVGSWLLDDERRLCVEVHAIYPADYRWQRTGTG